MPTGVVFVSGKPIDLPGGFALRDAGPDQAGLLDFAEKTLCFGLGDLQEPDAFRFNAW